MHNKDSNEELIHKMLILYEKKYKSWKMYLRTLIIRLNNGSIHSPYLQSQIKHFYDLSKKE